MDNNYCIYAICPANVATGGTEAIHSLVFELLKLGVSSAIYYTGAKSGINPVPQRFQKFDVPFITALDNASYGSIIIPETMTDMIERFPFMKKYIWWLSVDNYTRPLRICGPRTMLQLLIGRFFKRNIDFNDSRIYHCCQSYYAMEFVKSRGACNVDFLMDYLGDEHFTRKSTVPRENVVLYNPAKGFLFTWKIMRAAKGRLRFVALKGMLPSDVHDWCSRAKVYIDFGNHPGKDRFPREAAMAGCIVITSRRGSASFDEDVPIPIDYKFDGVSQEIPSIVDMLIDCMNNYDKRKIDFNRYREIIREERQQFINQIKSIFMCERKESRQ